MLQTPQSLLAPGARLLGLLLTRRLAARGWALKAQRRVASSLRLLLADTAYGRAHHIAAGMDDATWRDRVPLRTSEDFAPWVERMRRGEADVLWPGTCTRFTLTAGTRSGTPRPLPLTDTLHAHFQSATQDALLLFATRTGRYAIFKGAHAGLDDLPAQTGAAASLLPPWLASAPRAPGPDAASSAGDWPDSLDPIAQNLARLDLRLLAGEPCRLPFFATAVLSPSARGMARTLREVWPRLDCFLHRGSPAVPFAAELRSLLGTGAHLHEVYTAAEGCIAVQDAAPEVGLRLLADSGIHYEFLPVADFDPARLAQLGPKAVGLDAVKPGVDYALVMTTPAGLVRCLVGDIVRFVSTEPARLVYAGRLGQRLDAFGERTAEKDLSDALATVCSRHAWPVINFHVAPVVANTLTGRKHGYHEWWVELRPGTIDNPTGPVLAAELDVEIQRLNRDYAARRQAGALQEPVVRLVMPGVFEQWLRASGAWRACRRFPRCLPDRRLADELARVARFHDTP